jgi:hypothetical protein
MMPSLLELHNKYKSQNAPATKPKIGMGDLRKVELPSLPETISELRQRDDEEDALKDHISAANQYIANKQWEEARRPQLDPLGIVQGPVDDPEMTPWGRPSNLDTSAPDWQDEHYQKTPYTEAQKLLIQPALEKARPYVYSGAQEASGGILPGFEQVYGRGQKPSEVAIGKILGGLGSLPNTIRNTLGIEPPQITKDVIGPKVYSSQEGGASGLLPDFEKVYNREQTTGEKLLKFGGEFIPIGGLMKGASGTVARTGLKSPKLVRPAEAALAGGVYEGGKAIGEGKPLEEVAKDTAIGAVAWPAADLGLGLAFKGISKTGRYVGGKLGVKPTIEPPKITEMKKEAAEEGFDQGRERGQQNQGIDVTKLKDISEPSTQIRDIDRNFKEVYGPQYDQIRREILNQFDDSKKANIEFQETWVNKLRDEVVDRLGIKKGSKLSELVQKYGEGGTRYIKRQEGGNIEVFEPFTLEDLQKAAPKDWRKVVEADQWFRKAYDELIDLVNAEKEKIYPGARAAVEKIQAKISDLKDPLKWSKEAQDQAVHEIEWELKMIRESPRRRSDDETLLMQSLENKIQRIKQDSRYDSEARLAKIGDLEKESATLMRRYNVPKRSDYYRHFQELEGFEGIKNLFDTPANIDPHLEGTSAFTNPKSRWAGIFQQRGLGEYKQDAVGGFLNYLQPASYAIHIDPHISKFLNLKGELADSTAASGRLNNFIRFLDQYSRDLAGNTNPLDRWLQDTIKGGRKTFKIINAVNSRIKANVILGNASTMVAQVANIPQGIAFAKQHSAEGMSRAVRAIFKDDPAMAASGFLKERYGDQMYHQFDTKLLDNARNFAAWVMSTADRIGTTFIWQSSYAKGIAQKVADPIRFADLNTRRLVAGRGIGEVPLIQKSKVFQLVAPFQLEVGNLWHVMKDQVNEKDFGGLAMLLVANWLFNRGAEEVRGSPVVFDPIQAMIDAFEEKDTTPLQKAGRLGGEIVSNIPLGQTLTPLFMDEAQRRRYLGKEDPSRFGSGILLSKGIKDPLFKILPPFGGYQLEKTLKGANALRNKGVYENDILGGVVTDRGKKKYSVAPTLPNLPKGLLFGPGGLEETRKHYEKK